MIYFTGRICGDKCINDFIHNKCYCGEIEVDKSGTNYCCNIDSTCQKDKAGNVTCPRGQIFPHTQKCINECPTSTYTMNRMAILSTRCNDFTGRCFDSKHDRFNKICRNDFSRQPECGKSISCSKANNTKLTYMQCYSSDTNFVRYELGKIL